MSIYIHVPLFIDCSGNIIFFVAILRFRDEDTYLLKKKQVKLVLNHL